MVLSSFTFAVANSCQKSSTSATITGLVILVGIVGAVVALAIANSQARGRLAAANSELAYLRPENFRLQQWIAGLSGSPIPAAPTSGSPTDSSIPPQWHLDPAGRHELRFWDGTKWSDQVSDHGVTATDPLEGYH